MKNKNEILKDNICYALNDKRNVAYLLNADKCSDLTEIVIPEKITYKKIEYKVTAIAMYAVSYGILLST